ncbi:unnamed protein product, partial [Hapterophycus canaliculatus]
MQQSYQRTTSIRFPSTRPNPEMFLRRPPAFRFSFLHHLHHVGYRCSTCAMRSRVLLKDRSCPECKTVADRLLPASGDAPGFETFNLWGDFAGPDSKFDDESGMVFHACERHHDDLLRARDLYCPVGGC